MNASARWRLVASYAVGVWGGLTAWAALAQYVLPGRGHALGKLGSFHWVFVINLLPALLCACGLVVGLVVMRRRAPQGRTGLARGIAARIAVSVDTVAAEAGVRATRQWPGSGARVVCDRQCGRRRVAPLVGAAGSCTTMREGLQRLQSVCVVVVTALALCGCGRLQDDFRGDTDGGRIQLDVERVENASLDEVTQLRLRAGERAYERILLTHLPVGAEITVSASIARYGLYRRGGSWIFAGDRFLGRHAVWATVVAANSGSPDSLAVHIEPTRIVRRTTGWCCARSVQVRRGFHSRFSRWTARAGRLRANLSWILCRSPFNRQYVATTGRRIAAQCQARSCRSSTESSRVDE